MGAPPSGRMVHVSGLFYLLTEEPGVKTLQFTRNPLDAPGIKI